ncbi:MAG: hypothetical protein UX04_C0005G0055 [Microgenomates group bacterium GW2011_GWF2_45_18]|nr:MAG: hypothetical protein UW18_C0007G0055 [Microgenomates group bacterium GW2011_GWF1_44_10]KKU01636.1 MAG: hypothetical protein UX04_C0005G0055 [Microgenomates group bacterium GW2011_GWF2_45_18]OGJ41301.1 MAG: hypothetical protein A2378_04315 [Candidatus Pacebacteria bacterium RIFOXYB1_FULL_44_10]HAU99482.1 hypothetical protein [Candidatus Paceibacterota bacterium]HAX01453.1 hypothetical protein [Candidatus Paceibacterota bacterium]
MKKMLASPAFFLLWIAFVIWIVFSIIRGIQSGTDSARALEELHKRSQTLQQNLQDIQKKLEKADSSLERERIIRDQLGLQKPEEAVLLITPNPSP